MNKVESLADYVPTDPEERMDRVLELAPLFEGVELETGEPSAPSLKQVKRWIAKIRFKLREEEKEESAGGWATKTGTLPPPDTVSGASLRTERVLRLLEADDTQGNDFALARFQERLFTDFRRKIELIMASLDPVHLTVEGLPALLKKRFIGTSGRLVLQIYPKEDIWELGPQRRFVEQLVSVNPEVTGTAVQNYDATKSLLDAYIQGGLYAVCAILLILFVDVRHPVLVLLSIFPLLLTLLLSGCGKPGTVRLTREQYVDKCKGAWAGQMIGVAYGVRLSTGRVQVCRQSCTPPLISPPT